MKYNARFHGSLANAVARIAPFSTAFLVIVLGYGFFKGVPIEPRDWKLLGAVFGGSLIFTSLAMSISELFDWYEVDASGLTYHVEAGVGGARLIMKKTARATWSEIVDATPSRWLPYACWSLRIEHPSEEGAARYDSISLPLYLRPSERFLEELSAHVPAEHPLRALLRTSSF